MKTRKLGPMRDMMMPEGWYRSIDVGIRWPVRVLHAACIETQQSCQGGVGHSYHGPTVDLIAGAEDANGFAALRALQEVGIDVSELAIVWPVKNGLPYERLWRVVLKSTHEARANERPSFVHGYRAT